MTQFNDIQQIKRRFFAMRNGVIADTLRRSGIPYRIIFGLNLPQIADIAKETGQSADLARKLWANNSTRESMLLAPMIFPPKEMTYEEAQTWIAEASCVETVDILCHRLLRHLPFAWELALDNIKSDDDMHRYTAIRLMWNLIATHSSAIRPLAEAEAQRDCPLTRRAASSLVEEIDFLREA